MSDKQTLAINELKIQAKKQLKRSKQQKSNGQQAGSQSLKYYLQLVSAAIGFDSWQQASDILGGSAKPEQKGDFGTLFHHQACNALVNEWFADYQTAYKSFSQSADRYLLPYKKQFIVASKDYLMAIGLQEEDLSLVQTIQRDWIAGYGTQAWDRLASLLIRQRFE